MLNNTKQFYGITVTVTGTKNSLLSLLQAVDSTILGAAREISIQADPTNTQIVLIGDFSVAVSTQRCFLKLISGDSTLTRSGTLTQLPLAHLYVVAVSGSQLLNVGLFN